jgi:predicted RNase H-like HicB family nuclease
MNRLEYAVVVKPLSAEDGGGYVAVVPDLLGSVDNHFSHRTTETIETNAM